MCFSHEFLWHVPFYTLSASWPLTKPNSRSHLHGIGGIRLATQVQAGAAESMAEADPSSLPGTGSSAFQLGAVGTRPAPAAQEKS